MTPFKKPINITYCGKCKITSVKLTKCQGYKYRQLNIDTNFN